MPLNIMKQQELLGQLADILHGEAPAGYDEVGCRFKHEPDFDTISTQFWYRHRGEHVNAALSPGMSGETLVLTEELRALMKDHTGGEWSACTLTLDAAGNAHCDFEYAD